METVVGISFLSVLMPQLTTYGRWWVFKKIKNIYIYFYSDKLSGTACNVLP